MKTAGVAQLKAHLSELLTAVKAGDEISVTERGTPIARIVPIRPHEEPEPALRDLEPAGLIRRPVRSLGADFWELPRGIDTQGAVRAAFSAEREAGW